jgi:hypothetical protein
MKITPRFGAVLASAVLLTLAFTATSSAQTSLAFPTARPGADGVDGMTGLPVVLTDSQLVRDLTALQRVTLTDFAMPDGSTVDLELKRVDLDRLGFGYQVNGQPAPNLRDGLDLTVWMGSVVGIPQSEAVLGVSHRGTSGWVRVGNELVHMLPRAGAGNNWDAAEFILARDFDLKDFGLELGKICDIDSLGPAAYREGRPDHDLPSVSEAASDGGSCNVFECKVAVETDFQLYSLFNDLGAETAYITTLLAAISARYEEQIDTVLTFPYLQFYTTAADPWSTPDAPGSSIAMLNEFESAWNGNIPGGAVLGHFVSGASLGGGVAYLGVLCDTGQTFSFAVSGNLAGATPFPISVSPLNWDFMVIAHETGHNFNSPHTHDYSPQIDNCAGGACITNGTIMSYCHQCSGGLSNITTYFNDPAVVTVMKAHANTCLPSLAPMVADNTAQPPLIAPGVSTPLTVTVQGVPLGSVDLNYRLMPAGAFTIVAMSDLGGGNWSASLPATVCGDAPEWFFSMVDQACGPFQTATFAAEIGNETIVQFDDFEANLGWTVGDPADDATTGVWVLNDPNGTSAQPSDDVTSPGTDCWFTGQGTPGGSLGENDVDGGQTTLTSTTIDLSGGDARIGYWRWYSNDAGSTPNSDIFVVEVSNGGAWTNVETIGPAGAGTSGGWIYNEFTVSDFVSPNSTVQVRFIASDEGTGSIVEAAIDDFKVFRVDCGGAVTCQADLGFGGPGSATLSLCGGDLSTGASANLTLSGATPNALAVLFAGFSSNPTPFKGGQLVPIPWAISVLLTLDGSGDLTLVVPGGLGPLTMYVQYVYVDGGQALGYGLSNAVQAELLP